jgi:hypothetical protein
MSAQTALFLWLLTSGGGLGVVGCLFGAITGAWSWHVGRPAGTWLGLRLARVFSRHAETPPSPAATGALVGATDGLVFGAVVGTALGFVLASLGADDWNLLRPTLIAVAVVAVAGVFMGLLAGLVVRLGAHGVRSLMVGAMAGGMLGHYKGGTNGLFLGVLLGALAGIVVAWLGIRQMREEE